MFSYLLHCIFYCFAKKKIRIKSETSEKKEVTDFVASDLPDQSLPSEKDTIQLAALLLC